MDLQTCMEQRRSVRKYTNQPVPRELVREIIQAAILAPSWKNSQVSRYYVAEGNAEKELAKCLADFNRQSVQNAPVLIVSTVVNKRSGFTRNGEYETHLKGGFQYYDHGMQAMNLCLKAHELGLATLIMGIYDEAAIRKFFNIDENQIIVAVIAVGYAAEEPPMPKRKTVDDITVFKE
ncbi:nitroreductase family protein [Treponema sp. OMZ 857]|uniref:nitroreductase family protein n=1 Tax=Treponema sp. OMZ 857 TaxID=1643513 RepID=UPI0020A4CB94|nr:nitroreductase family protein [Treponema sp. OMZ 857]UTC44622.1 nitroreductase [Treponema sp. OMZ 857]